MSLKTLTESLKGAVTAHESASKAYDELSAKLAPGAAETAECKSAREAADAARDKVAALTVDVEKATSHAEAVSKANGILGRADRLNEVDIPTNQPLHGKGYRDLKDEDEGEAKHVELFAKYMQSGLSGMSSKDMDVLAPKSEAFVTKDAREGVVLPGRVVARMMGQKFAAMCGYDVMSKAALSTSNAAGGYTIPQEFRAILAELPTEAPALLPLCTTIPTRTGTITIPRLKQTDANEYGGVSVAWTSEGGAKNYAEAEFEQVSIAAHELSGYTEISLRLLARSALALEAIVGRMFRGAIIDAIDTALISGSGTGQPMGVMNTAGVRQVSRGTVSVVKYADLVNLKYGIKPYHRANGIYVIQDGTCGELEASLDSLNRPLFTPSVSNGIFDRLAGKPYVSTTRAPAKAAAGEVMFGDAGEIYVPMEQEVVAKRSDDYKFRNNLAAFAIFCVVGGQLVQPRTWAYLNSNS